MNTEQNEDLTEKDLMTSQEDVPVVNAEKDPEAIVFHPLLMLEGDNFTFTPPIMDSNFYEGLYGLSMKLNVIRQSITDPELTELSQYLETFLMSCAQKAQQDDLIAKPMLKDWEAKVKDIVAKLKDAETTPE